MKGTEVVATTADPAFAVDRDGRILAWNGAAEQCLGYRSSEVVGHDCWEVLQGQDASLNSYCDVSCPVRTMALRNEPIHRTRMYFRNASGGTTEVSMSTLVVRAGEKKEIVHLLRCLSSRPEKSPLPSGATAATSGARLSPRQLEVLRLLGDGKRTGEIAELLCISPATVRHHVQGILNRLKAHSRLSAVTLARRIGLI